MEGHEEIEWTQLSNEDKKACPEKASVEGRHKQGGIIPNRSPILLPESGGHVSTESVESSMPGWNLVAAHIELLAPQT